MGGPDEGQKEKEGVEKKLLPATNIQQWPMIQNPFPKNIWKNFKLKILNYSSNSNSLSYKAQNSD